MSNNCHDDPVELDHRKRSPPGGDLHQRPLKREKYLDLSNEAISFVLPAKKDARIDPPSVSGKSNILEFSLVYSRFFFS